MHAAGQSKLKMFTEVHGFCLANPFANQSYEETVVELDETLDEAGILLQRQEASARELRVASVAKRMARLDIRENHARIIVRIAQGAADSDPTLPNRFRMPGSRAAERVFMVTVRNLADEADRFRAPFLAAGLPESFTEDLRQALSTYERAIQDFGRARTTRKGATADLEEVIRRLDRLVDRLDGINSARFRKDTELLAAWRGAMTVIGPAKRKARTPKPATAQA